MHTTLITATELMPHLGDPRWVVVDCRFDLTNPARGEEQYLAGHIPGARYVHLDRDLSGEKTGSNGRHPLPTPEQMAERFGALGIGADTQVVAYDADTGMYAARLWWMLRFMGHDARGRARRRLRAWLAAGGDVQRGPGHARRPATFAAAPRDDWRLTVDQVAAGGHACSWTPGRRSASAARTRRIDKVGGHIPGACNYFFQQNLTADKTFKPPDELRRQWEAVPAAAGPHGRGDVLRLRRDRLPQPPGPRSSRSAGIAHLPGLVERVERESEPPRRELTSEPRRVAGR